MSSNLIPDHLQAAWDVADEAYTANLDSHYRKELTADVSMHALISIAESLARIAAALEVQSHTVAPVPPPFDAQCATCPEPGGCDSCPNPNYCEGLRVGIGITTVDQERAAEVSA